MLPRPGWAESGSLLRVRVDHSATLEAAIEEALEMGISLQFRQAVSPNRPMLRDAPNAGFWAGEPKMTLLGKGLHMHAEEAC